MKWCFAAVGALFLAGGVRSQFLVEPSTKADPNTIKDCTWWHVVASGDTCALIESSYSVTHQQFTTYVSLLTSPTFCSRLALNSSTVESIPGERLLSCRGQLVLHRAELGPTSCIQHFNDIHPGEDIIYVHDPVVH